jgi:hypothetical protein
MKKYNIINYRINKSVKPIEVLQEIERLMQKNNASCLECFIKLEVSIIEFEYEGKLHSNRNKNAILMILKHYPELKCFFEHKKQIDEDGSAKETLTIQNFVEETFSPYGKVEYLLIKEIAEKIPRPYSLNNFEVIFSGTNCGESPNRQNNVRPPSNGFGSHVGNYIMYCRSNYGSEKHAYMHFSVDDDNLESMRSFFFEFAKNIGGKYVGTEYHT